MMKIVCLALVAMLLVGCGGSSIFVSGPTSVPSPRYLTPQFTPKPLLATFTPIPTATRPTATPFPTWTPSATSEPKAVVNLKKGDSALFYDAKTGKSMRIGFVDYSGRTITFQTTTNIDYLDKNEVIEAGCYDREDTPCWFYAAILRGGFTDFIISMLPSGEAQVVSPPGWLLVNE